MTLSACGFKNGDQLYVGNENAQMTSVAEAQSKPAGGAVRLEDLKKEEVKKDDVMKQPATKPAEMMNPPPRPAALSMNNPFSATDYDPNRGGFRIPNNLPSQIQATGHIANPGDPIYKPPQQKVVPSKPSQSSAGTSAAAGGGAAASDQNLDEVNAALIAQLMEEDESAMLAQ